MDTPFYILRMYHILPNHFLMDGKLGCFSIFQYCNHICEEHSCTHVFMCLCEHSEGRASCMSCNAHHYENIPFELT